MDLYEEVIENRIAKRGTLKETNTISALPEVGNLNATFCNLRMLFLLTSHSILYGIVVYIISALNAYNQSRVFLYQLLSD
jgi:hypothetical protein